MYGKASKIFDFPRPYNKPSNEWDFERAKWTLLKNGNIGTNGWDGMDSRSSHVGNPSGRENHLTPGFNLNPPSVVVAT
jgi:hypothetical protein